MNNERILALGWTPLYNFEEGLREYLLTQWNFKKDTN
jgi:nucleoside-diphosphate-sugar epimerase